MFKSKPKDRYLFSTRRKKRRQRRFSFVLLLFSGLLGLVVLELATRIFLDVKSKRAEETQINDDQNIIDSYQLKFLDSEQVNTQSEISTDSPEQTLNQERLLAQRALSVGYKLVPNQKNEYWQINDKGFRDRQALPIVKPANEIRVFLLGSSTAFGYGSLSNQNTISELLEQRLNKRINQQKSSPELYQPKILPNNPVLKAKALKKPAKIKNGNYRVINAAIPGYVSGNQLAQLALEVMSYKPDILVVFNGYEDLMLTENQKATQIPSEENYLDTLGHLQAFTYKLLTPIEKYSYLVRWLQNKVVKPEDIIQERIDITNKTGQELADLVPQTPESLQLRINRYFHNHQQIANLSAGSKTGVILVTQPEITGRNPAKLTPTEGEITTQMGRKYIQSLKANYPRFAGANKHLAKLFPHVKDLNLYKIGDQYPSPSFIDAIHLTETANAMVAEQIYQKVSGLDQIQTVPPKPSPVKVLPTKNSKNNSRSTRQIKPKPQAR